MRIEVGIADYLTMKVLPVATVYQSGEPVFTH